jgi:hypothetical protein
MWGPTNRPTDRPTDKESYKDAMLAPKNDEIRSFCNLKMQSTYHLEPRMGDVGQRYLVRFPVRFPLQTVHRSQSWCSPVSAHLGSACVKTFNTLSLCKMAVVIHKSSKTSNFESCIFASCRIDMAQSCKPCQDIILALKIFNTGTYYA